MVSQGYSMVKKWIPIFLSTCDFKIKWLSCKLFHKSNDYDIGAQREFIQQPREFIQSNCSSGHLANYFFLRLDPSMPRNHAFVVSKTSSYHHFIFMSIYICPIIFCVKNLSSPPENTPCCVPLVARGEPRLFTTTSGPNGRVEQVGTRGTRSIAHSWPMGSFALGSELPSGNLT